MFICGNCDHSRFNPGYSLGVCLWHIHRLDKTSIRNSDTCVNWENNDLPANQKILMKEVERV